MQIYFSYVHKILTQCKPVQPPENIILHFFPAAICIFTKIFAPIRAHQAALHSPFNQETDAVKNCVAAPLCTVLRLSMDLHLQSTLV